MSKHLNSKEITQGYKFNNIMAAGLYETAHKMIKYKRIITGLTAVEIIEIIAIIILILFK